MWMYLRPIIVIVFIVGLAFIFTRSCVESTGEHYYHAHYPGVVFRDGYWHAPRPRGIRGGK